MGKDCDAEGNSPSTRVSTARETDALLLRFPTGAAVRGEVERCGQRILASRDKNNEKRGIYMAYCIMRVEKRKRSALYGLQIEANRTSAYHERGRDFSASDIQWELTPFNMFQVKAENWGNAIRY